MRTRAARRRRRARHRRPPARASSRRPARRTPRRSGRGRRHGPSALGPAKAGRRRGARRRGGRRQGGGVRASWGEGRLHQVGGPSGRMGGRAREAIAPRKCFIRWFDPAPARQASARALLPPGHRERGHAGHLCRALGRGLCSAGRCSETRVLDIESA